MMKYMPHGQPSLTYTIRMKNPNVMMAKANAAITIEIFNTKL
jgi:hypothetical protein